MNEKGEIGIESDLTSGSLGREKAIILAVIFEGVVVVVKGVILIGVTILLIGASVIVHSNSKGLEFDELGIRDWIESGDRRKSGTEIPTREPARQERGAETR